MVDDLAALLAGAGAEFEDAVGGADDVGVVLDDEQRVAGVAKAPENAVEAPDVARMQADGGLVEDEERVDEVAAERGGERDALRLAAGERPRLAVEREVVEADGDEVLEAR